MIGGGSLDNVPIGQLYKDLECKFDCLFFHAYNIKYIQQLFSKSELIDDSVRLNFPLYSLKNNPLSGFIYHHRCIVELMHPLKSLYRVHNTLYHMSWITAFVPLASAVLHFLCHYTMSLLFIIVYTNSTYNIYWKRILFMFFTDLLLFSRYHLPLSKVFYNLEKSIHLCLCKFYIKTLGFLAIYLRALWIWH